jgi:hypothetical protein
MNLTDMVNEIEAAGACFRLEGEKVRVWYPTEERRDELAARIAFLRSYRAEVRAFLTARTAIPVMPPGVCLVRWNLKPPPVVVETGSVVFDSALFARSTLMQLGDLMANPNRNVGWTVPQLIDRLAQVGVAVSLKAEVS